MIFTIILLVYNSKPKPRKLPTKQAILNKSKYNELWKVYYMMRSVKTNLKAFENSVDSDHPVQPHINLNL